MGLGLRGLRLAVRVLRLLVSLLASLGASLGLADVDQDLVMLYGQHALHQLEPKDTTQGSVKPQWKSDTQNAGLNLSSGSH